MTFSPASPAQRPAKRKPTDTAAAERWAAGARSRGCVVRNCAQRGPVRGHHILKQQTLRRIAADLGLDYETVRWDDRNRLPLCDLHHGELHSGKRRVALVSLPVEALRFACELDDLYPEGQEPAFAALERQYARAAA